MIRKNDISNNGCRQTDLKTWEQKISLLILKNNETLDKPTAD